MGLRGPNAKPVAFEPKVGPADYRNNLDAVRPWEVGRKSRAEKVVAFLETLPVTSGNLSGQNFRVRDWQWRDIIEPLYRTDEQGRRIAREGFISMPRRNGKSGIVSGLAMCHLCGPEAVQRGQVASGAAERDQAAIIFDEMCAIIERVPWMNQRIIVKNFNRYLEDSVTGTTYKALSSESKTKHGRGYSFWIYDELAQAPDRKLYDVLSTSGGSWDEPLGIVMSTQSEDPRHIMSLLYDSAKQVQDGIIVDPSQHACIYSAPMDADPWDEATWFGCNPALGDFRSLEDMRMLARKAKRMPASELTFRLLYLNQRVSAEVRFLPPGEWDACGREDKDFGLEELSKYPCYAALDLSGSGHNDLTAMVLMFSVGETLKVLPFFWAAADSLEQSEARDRAPYRLWAKDGHLQTTPGRVLDYTFIANQIGELTKKFTITACAVDPWNLDRMTQALNTHSVTIALKKHDQHHVGMEPAVQSLESAVLSGKLQHSKNPVLAWCLDNVMVSIDSNGNRKFDKRKATGRIDGSVALAMACELASQKIKQPEYNVFF